MYPLTSLIIPSDDESPTEMRTLNEWRDIQRAVDGTFDCIQAALISPETFKPHLLDVWVNDEGLIWKLPLNRRASYLCQRMIVGDACVLGPPTRDGESTNVPDWVQNTIDAWQQAYIREIST